ncbi:calpain-like cysteine peptidase [Trypanosoma conorhini]|uniref:Calpain-like cysteine peptidase n=1 Tax=Trypanosoma conorhini TaxID=83891 RepID=A0A3R7L361_9TRYP|nr:calpain-like cysteine peptidase [Trypanosoma conorhini]RNF20122.1 calpain-like cysteine peptidase [Trypanosoma conorhini]
MATMHSQSRTEWEDGETADVDEFGEASVEPISLEKEKDKPWRECGPTCDGEWTSCFEGGYLFRIVSEKKKWAFYNDTNMFEMLVVFTFGRDSQIKAEGNTKITRNENGEFVATAVIYPLETVMFISGNWSGYRSHVEGRPLSRGYLERIAQANEGDSEKAMLEVRRLCPSGDAEVVLAACIAHSAPFVDPEFPPTSSSLDKGKGLLSPLPWRRPSEYLPKELAGHVALFRMPVTAFSMRRGDLSDSWVMTAMAALAENAEYVKNMFRHPVDRSRTAKEAGVGAHRVLLNRDGMWKSYLVDNYLPVVGSGPRFAQNGSDPCEMWVPLLEKAYAKRNGGFANICTGDPLMALCDFTGCPTTRLDTAFLGTSDNPDKSIEFFERLVALSASGHIILFSTPGLGSDKAKLINYKERGIAIGYALAVLNVRRISGYCLLRLRNPWSRGVRWEGNWGPASRLWDEHPEVAAACPGHDGAEGSLWMDWDEMKEYFVGCGVVFNLLRHYDYRVPGIFAGAAPSVCLEIAVAAPVTLASTLSQPEHRGTEREALDYEPLMLSLAYGTGHAEEFAVVANTSKDAENPHSAYVFLHGRDLSMIYEFRPEHSPYLLLPRRMELAAETEAATLPFTLGLHSPTRITERGAVSVAFRALSASNEVFENYQQFTNDGAAVSATYQVKFPNSRLEELTADRIV